MRYVTSVNIWIVSHLLKVDHLLKRLAIIKNLAFTKILVIGKHLTDENLLNMTEMSSFGIKFGIKLSTDIF